MFAHIPGLRVVVPSSPQRAYGLLLAAIRDPDPVIFLEPTRIYRAVKQEVEDDGVAMPLDDCFVLREGGDLTLVTWGAMVKETLAAADRLRAERISAEVIDVATLKPLDFETILGLGREDRALRDRARGAADRRLRRRDRGAARREGPALAAGAGRAGDRLRRGRCRCCASSITTCRARRASSRRRGVCWRLPELREGIEAMRTFNLPDLGEGLQEAEIVSWHVSPGDQVVADQPLVSVETDKAVVEVPSPCCRARSPSCSAARATS